MCFVVLKLVQVHHALAAFVPDEADAMRPRGVEGRRKSICLSKPSRGRGRVTRGVTRATTSNSLQCSNDRARRLVEVTAFIRRYNSKDTPPSHSSPKRMAFYSSHRPKGGQKVAGEVALRSVCYRRPRVIRDGGTVYL